MRDVTARKLAEDELTKYRDRLEGLVEQRTAELKTINERLEKEIAERAMAQRALSESEEKYRALVETTDTAFAILDQEGTIMDANREFVRLTGHRVLDEIMGRKVKEWTAPHDVENNSREIKKCLEQGSVKGLEIDYINSLGVTTPVEINATVVRTDKGPRIHALLRDITARRDTEIETAERGRFQQNSYPGITRVLRCHESRRHYHAYE